MCGGPWSTPTPACGAGTGARLRCPPGFDAVARGTEPARYDDVDLVLRALRVLPPGSAPS